MDRSILAIGCAAGLLLAAPQSRASTIIDVASAGISPANLASISIDYSGPGGPVVDSDVYAGVINLNVSASSPFDAGLTLGVFCIDVFKDLVTTGGTFIAEGALENGNNVTLSPTTESQIGWLVNNYFDPTATTSASALGMTPNEFAAATQLAIWQTEYTSAFFSFNSYGDTLLNEGGISDPGFVSVLEGLIGPFAGNIDEWEPYNTTTDQPDPSLNQGQAFIGGSGITNNEPIPEPASLALLSAGMIGLAAVRRRKRG